MCLIPKIHGWLKAGKLDDGILNVVLNTLKWPRWAAGQQAYFICHKGFPLTKYLSVEAVDVCVYMCSSLIYTCQTRAAINFDWRYFNPLITDLLCVRLYEWLSFYAVLSLTIHLLLWQGDWGRPPSWRWYGVNQSWFGSQPQKCHLSQANEDPTNITHCQSRYTLQIFQTSVASLWLCKSPQVLLLCPLLIPSMSLGQTL